MFDFILGFVLGLVIRRGHNKLKRWRNMND